MNRIDWQRLKKHLLQLSMVIVAISLVTSCGGGKKNVRKYKYSKKYKKHYGVKTFAADAVPKVEPLSKWGNPPSYSVFGKTYYVRTSSKNYVERGIASWYGKKFHGKRTSSGEPYDMYGMTAAHKTLPLPTYARVTNLENGRTIVVRINDRGPFVDNRLIDLTYSGAKRLGMLGKGTALVEVRAIDPLQKPFSQPKSYLAEKSPKPATKPVPLRQFATNSRTSTLPTTLKRSVTTAPMMAMAPAPGGKPNPGNRRQVTKTESTHRSPNSQMLSESVTDLPQTGFTATRVNPPPPSVTKGRRQVTSSTVPRPRNTMVQSTKKPRYKGNFRHVPAPVTAPARTPLIVARRPATRYYPSPRSTQPRKPYRSVRSRRYTSYPGQRYSRRPASRRSAKKRYRLYLQLGAFYNFENAHRLYNRLAALRVGTLNIHRARKYNRTLYRVRIGPLPNVALLDRISMQLSRKGIRGSKVVID